MFTAGPAVPTWTFFGLGAALMLALVAVAVSGGRPAWLVRTVVQLADHLALGLGLMLLGVALLTQKEAVLSQVGAGMFLIAMLYGLSAAVWVCGPGRRGTDQ